MHLSTLAVLGIAVTAAVRLPGADLDTVLDRIDRAGASLHTMTAKVHRVSHTDVINEDNPDNGSILLKRTRTRDLRMLIEVTDPDPKTVTFQGHKLDVYYPKIKTVQEYNVGKSRELLEEYFLVGFGTSRAELEASYQLRLLGEENIAGQKSAHLELIPKSKEVLQHLLKLELWVSGSGYPVQQKFSIPGGDYQLATYSDVKINPELPETELRMHLPKDVKWEYPQK